VEKTVLPQVSTMLSTDQEEACRCQTDVRPFNFMCKASRKTQGTRRHTEPGLPKGTILRLMENHQRPHPRRYLAIKELQTSRLILSKEILQLLQSTPSLPVYTASTFLYSTCASPSLSSPLLPSLLLASSRAMMSRMIPPSSLV
jgi:hypothetical protein